MKQQAAVRIIGGIYRGRKLDVLQDPLIRPTPDRLREDLFNLIKDKVTGAVVLDLFAGSGVLGFEALSRGASQITLVENHYRNYLNLCRQKESFNNHDAIRVVNEDALSFLNHCSISFDVIFLDPPYKSNLLPQSLDLIIKNKLLSAGGLVYAESSAGHRTLFKGFEVVSTKTSGQVSFCILKKSSLLS